ncbi:hypothetical protein SLS60_006487 [Paraconiothyrium brasiliense]|uniref:Heme haloperoxidase family profile domain-containing protein n=1 Tax=Paraconiothyrium brasiliense TaxID=300254 RepID=A0ABR3RCB8_9PLEO
MPLSTSPILRIPATFFGIVFLGFGVAYTLYPRAAYPTIGLPSPTTPRDAEIVDAIMVLFGAKDLFVGLSILAATWLGNRKVAGLLLMAGSGCAAVDGWVVNRFTGEGEWNHWGYGVVMGIVGSPEEQRIDVTGEHRFIPPDLPKDYRGPCPALNALSNHGYIPRNGIASIDQIVAASTRVFGFDETFANIAAIYSTAFTVSPDLNNISIGAPLQSSDVLPDKDVKLKIAPQGLEFTHIGLEHDASPTRLDKYEPSSSGNNYDLSLPLFQQLLDRQEGIADHKVNFNIEVLAHHRYQRIQDSIRNNPKFFFQPFNGCFLQGHKHAVIYRAFANHSMDHPLGRLDRRTLMSFYGVQEDGNKLNYDKGGERIPDFWYRRPLDDTYDLRKSNDDLLEMAGYHPDLIDQYCAGGTSEEQKYDAIDIDKLTNGTYKTSTLRDGYNLSCAGFVTSTQTAPYWLLKYYDDFGKTVVPRLLAKLPPLIAGLGCSKLDGTLDRKAFEVFLGFNESLNVP